jgi:membrane-bound metal-dependent hydrolase YbcI (DUF457 family)
MNWKFHLIFGAILGALAALFVFHFELPEILRFSAIAGISALLPDLDTRSSKASQVTYVLAGAAILAAALYLSGGVAASAMAYLAALIAAFFLLDFFLRPPHRGLMHGLVFLSIASLLAYFALGGLVASAFLLGYFSHLLSDGVLKLA